MDEKLIEEIRSTPPPPIRSVPIEFFQREIRIGNDRFIAPKDGQVVVTYENGEVRSVETRVREVVYRWPLVRS